eukprot:UN3443
MGVETEMAMKASQQKTAMPEWASLVEICFVAVFSVELIVRAVLQGPRFYRCPQVRLNLFDLAIVLFQLVDVIFVVYNVSPLRSLRILRIISAARMVRGFEYVRELRLLLIAITECLPALFWVLLLFLVMLYLWSIFLLQSIQGHVAAADSPDPRLLKHYGSMGSCMLTLFEAITGCMPLRRSAGGPS